MSKTVVAIVFLCSLLFARSAFPQPEHHSSGTHSSTHHSSKATKAKRAGGDKSVHVRGYTRKDGTYVAPYERGVPGSAGSGVYKKSYIAKEITPDSSVRRDRNGKIKRSSSAKAAFERQSPCPLTGKTSGRCPGYVVDHVNPLECGGADAPTNMQWQTTADAKTKDRTERSCRQ
jgi:hypothetical protein